MRMFSALMPSSMKNLADAMPAAPAPSRQLEGVEKGGPTDDGGPVLVVVEDGDVETVSQGLLDDEALGRLDVLEIDAAHRRGQHLAEPDDIVGFRRVDLQVEDIDVCEALEQDPLALHDRLAGERSDVAQAEHGRPIGHHADEIPAIREPKRSVCIFGNDETRLGDSRGVGEAEVGLGRGGLGRPDRRLTRRRLFVILQCLGESGFAGHQTAEPISEERSGARPQSRGVPLDPCTCENCRER
jgi:hypothetical protein